MEWKKNQEAQVEITGVTAQGAGVGRLEGLAVFVPLTAPGDVVRIKLLKVAKNYAWAKVTELLTPSPLRQEPDCPQFAQCGGCCYRHITYQGELELKTQRVRDALNRIGGFPQLPLRPILGAESRSGYRNKALLPLDRGKDGRLTLGFYAVNSHRVVDCPRCLLQPREFDLAMEAFRRWAAQYGDPIYDESTHTGVLRRLYLRKGFRTGEVLACVVANAPRLRHEKELVEAFREQVPGLASVVLNVHRDKTNVALGKECRTLWGKDAIEDQLCGLTFRLSPLSFYQVNRDQAERLYQKAAEYAALTGEEFLLDLYCGTGTIGLSMANRAKKLLGVEVIPQAVENARENARANGVENASFLCGDAAQAAAELEARGERPQVVILDPPRKGCSPELVRTVAAMAPQRVVYVSCDPATLARDLKLFAQLGYPPVEATPVDMFPGTAHVETVVLLSKLNAKQHIEVELNLDELDLTSAESKATYDEIKAYVLEHTGLKVSHLYIAQVKQKYGIIERENYNKPKSENSRQPKCPPEKEAAIMEALKHFQMLE